MLVHVFAGFPPEAIRFFEGLEAENSKPYWEAHRDTYETAVRGPMEDLVEELGPEFGAAKVFRPYRDTRFSKDKSPYKTTCAALLYPDGAKLVGHYVGLSSSGVWVGGGVYHPDPSALSRVRKAIDDEGAGEELAAIERQLADDGIPLHGPELKTAPRGYARDHPRIDLLRRKRFVAMAHHPAGKWLHGRKALDRVVGSWRATRPLQEWLEKHGA
jgi:uncharacterized protein (TIGR02453 family)